MVDRHVQIRARELKNLQHPSISHWFRSVPSHFGLFTLHGTGEVALASGRVGSSSTKRHWLLRVKAHWEPMSTQMAKRLKDGEPIVSAMLMEGHYTLQIRKLSYVISMSEI